MVRLAIRTWLTLGGGGLTYPVVRSSGTGWPLGEALASSLPGLAAVAVFVDGPEKITAQLMDPTGRTLAYAKYAVSAERGARLGNEARMLTTAPATARPELIHYGPMLEGEILVQSPVRGSPCAPSARLREPLRRFLRSLVQPGRVFAAADHPFIRRVHESGGQDNSVLDEIADRLSVATWPVVWMHGDFTFRNVYQWRGSCVAFDWEYGCEDGFPYLDAAGWALGITKFIRREDRTQAGRYVAEVVADCLPDHLKGAATSIAALAAWYRLGPEVARSWLR